MRVIVSRGQSGIERTFHTDPDCPRILGRTYERDRDELADAYEWSECGTCSGEQFREHDQSKAIFQAALASGTDDEAEVPGR